MSEEKKLEFVEFESKYRVEPSILTAFGILAESLPDFREFIYAAGPDQYYVKDDSFVRYRKEANKGPNSRAELTMKTKPKGAKNNIIRKELNVRVDGTPPETIKEFVSDLGFKFNFAITKRCHIYRMEDATLVAYSVADITDGIPKNEDHFVEIEIDEEKLKTMTADQAWEVLIKYEKALELVGITPQRRLKKSLFEMYRRDA